MPAARLCVILRGRLTHTTTTFFSRMSEVGSTTQRTEDCQNRLTGTMAIVLRTTHPPSPTQTYSNQFTKPIDPASSTISRPLASMAAVNHLDETTACLGLGLEEGMQTIDASVTTYVSAKSVKSVASTLSTTTPTPTRTANTATGINGGMRALSLSLSNQTVVVVVVVTVAARASHATDDGQMASLRLRPPHTLLGLTIQRHRNTHHRLMESTNSYLYSTASL
jgi:hypothetical protein